MTGGQREYSRRQFTLNEELTQKISHSVFVTNFSDYVNSGDLWEKCSVYRTVVAVFIPSKKSKAGKRFAFVRFIKVFNLDRLVVNLCTLWIGSYHLFANQVRYDRPNKPSIHKSNILHVNGTKKVPIHGDGFLGSKQQMGGATSNVSAVNGATPLIQPGYSISPALALVLDDECIVEKDFSKCAIGRVKVFDSIPNLQSILADEGFVNVKISYLGGKVFMVRAKELFTWNPNFESHKEKVYSSDDESVQGEELNENRFNLNEKGEGELNGSEDEEVAETIFMDNSSSSMNHCVRMDKQYSADPFGLNDLLGKKIHELETLDPSPSLSHPPGFSPMGAKVMNNSQVVQDDVSYTSGGANLLEILVVSFVFGRSLFLGKIMLQSRILFVAIYGTWIPNKTKILIVSIYAPHQPSLRRVLWDYLSILLGRWNGEAILMGDYNEVRTNDERRGTWFNFSNASSFNQFISSSDLVDIKMEGYTFTWSYPSAEKRVSLIVKVDFGPIPFRFYYSWFKLDGFDDMVEQTWSAFDYSDNNSMIRFKKKLQELKKVIRLWINVKKSQLAGSKNSIVLELRDIDKQLDQIGPNDLLIFRRDENSKYFHGIINKKRSHLAIRGVFNDGIWRTDPSSVKKAFREHYEARFNKPTTTRLKLRFPFPKRLSIDQVDDLERGVSHDEIRSAVWDCGDNKSPGPDGFTFEFFKKYWRFIGLDFCEAVEHFFSSLVSDTQSAFLADRQILDGPFILNEVLDWCKRKNKQAMFFKVDFAKAYDSVRWNFLIDVLEAFGFGSTWCNWIRGTFCYAKASILVNGSPSDEFHLHCGLKQGDPLSPYLFILVMESNKVNGRFGFLLLDFWLLLKA
uniref:RNA-directed DNA polymerase, eukaryota n=1 Tax=Tanacetum cinerariifolium TaxID=118510 RepID=A0A699HJC9_TANCI|nr:RNA-directed DNA polymerase, eukaryota [Tanacetum cinerariifolium]